MSLKRRAVLMAIVAMGIGYVPGPVHARRVRVRLRGSGLRRGQACPGYPVMPKADLRECLIKEQAVNSHGDAVDKVEAEIKALSERIQQEESVLAAQESAVNRYSQASVDAYNQKVRRYQALVDEYNRKVSEHAAMADKANTKVAEFNRSCTTRCYYEHDMAALQREMGQNRNAQ